MSTIDRETLVSLPPLVDGQRLDRATFHERYAAMPDETRAELIEGVVYMASPLGMAHGRNDVAVIIWLDHYEEATPGVEILHNSSVFLGDHGEHQPDIALRILPSSGGRSRDQGKYYADGPELVVEVSDSTLAKDLGPRLRDYDRAGVPEYVVLAVNPPAVRWHKRIDGRLVLIAPDADGLYRSTVFPGLWLDPESLLAREKTRLRAIVDQGVATPEHAAFVQKLATQREKPL